MLSFSRLFYSCLLLCSLVFLAPSLIAQTYAVNSLPTQLSGEWDLCQFDQENSQLTNCAISTVPEKIETHYPDEAGIYVYTTTFTLSSTLQNQAVSLYIKQLRDADEVYINGVLVGKTSEFLPDFKKATLYPRSYHIPTSILKYQGNNSLVIRFYNHARHGGIINEAPIIDSTENVQTTRSNDNAFLMMYCGMILLIAAIQIFYFLAQPEHKEHLIFSLLCITQMFYLWTYSDFALYSGIDLNFIFRLNVALFNLLTCFFMYFLITFFKKKSPLLISVAVSVLIANSISALLLVPIDYIYYSVHLLEGIVIFVLAPYTCVLFYDVIKTKQPFSRVMAIALAGYIATVFLDIAIDLQLVDFSVVGITGLVSPLFLIFVFITFTIILIQKHWQYYRNATYDYLTQCLRRSAFNSRLFEEYHRVKRTNNSLLVALLDIDNFKAFNDNHSHLVGDEVLVEAAERIRKTLREFDLLGRYGGDEFIIAAEVQDKKDALNLLKRIHSAITDEPLTTRDLLSLSMQTTIGAYVISSDEDATPTQMVEKADAILVKGKVNQKGRVHI